MGFDRERNILPYSGRTYTVTDGTWASGPALRSFGRVADDWGLDGSQRAAALGVEPVRLNAWADQAFNGDFPQLPDDVLVALTHVLVLRRELTLGGVVDQAEWLRRPYDYALFGNGRFPERPVEPTPLETILWVGVRWVRELFHPREELGAYPCPDYGMLADGHHDWLPEPSIRSLASGAGLRSGARVLSSWGASFAHPKLILAQNHGFVEVDDATLTRLSHVLNIQLLLNEMLGRGEGSWAATRAWMRRPHPEIFGTETTPVTALAGDPRAALTLRQSLGAHLGHGDQIQDGPDYPTLMDEDRFWMVP